MENRKKTVFGNWKIFLLKSQIVWSEDWKHEGEATVIGHELNASEIVKQVSFQS